jgi:hypothetical protein
MLTRPERAMPFRPRYLLYCRGCSGIRVHVGSAPRHARHAALAIGTLGLWLPFWIMDTLLARRPKCRGCGRRGWLSRTMAQVVPKQKPRPVSRGVHHLNPAA